jgi:hypothetical protein
MLLPPPRETAASAFMATRLGGIRGSATAIRLLQSGLATSTAQGYGNLFARFAEFCDEEGVSALPATTATVISYIGHLADLGTWAASSMQPIFSAINDAHRSLELAPPACDSFFLKRVRTGLGRVQAAVTTTDARTPLPAEAAVEPADSAQKRGSCVVASLANASIEQAPQRSERYAKISGSSWYSRG